MTITPDKIAVLVGGLVIIGLIRWYFFPAHRAASAATTNPEGIQEVAITIDGGYQPSEIRVRSGSPVRLVFDRRETNPCSAELVMPDLRIHRELPAHQRTPVEFTPAHPGVYEFKCGMGMLHGRVIAS